MSETFICTNCGETCEIHQMYEIGDDQLCASCADDLTVTCERCDERIYLDDNAGTDSFALCSDCYEAHYTNCTHCNCLITLSDAYYDDDSDDPYCYDCNYDRQQEDDYIHDYSYKPVPIFYGDGNLYMGVELEIDDAGKSDGNAQMLTELANRTCEHIYIKSDGSLDDGLEIVTHPMTLDYHLHQMPWREVMGKALEMGYCSHRTGTCGLHVHVNRSFFGDTVEIQEQAISRVLYFVEHHWAELLQFSRRTEQQLKRWAARYGYKERPYEILDTAKKGYGGRYTCVNIFNRDTIELRIFRGTLKYNTLAATLQLVKEICNVAILLSDEELAAQSWSAFVESLDKTKMPELITYLKERRLYVNDPIIAEEDE
ncbi:amidoligase family protein [Oscillospiraceae bacterium PP1C4]